MTFTAHGRRKTHCSPGSDFDEFFVMEITDRKITKKFLENQTVMDVAVRD